ncbi:cyclase family protein [Halogeometricum limi]|uniref:Kynurenine formamidase n=1 Tax=Halogeometricum limi TaxID=555875 RepID=A0A1I6ICE0_9EURY|nr:cyclase family protein [Halogeometricum limi]SFR64363.1 Kynurenine formamidase [Halogeometricum limi]
MVTLVDLSQEIYHDQPVYHTHQKTVMWTDTAHEDTKHMFEEELGREPPFSFETRGLLLCDHGPTHVDAPAHYREDGATTAELPLEQFYTPGKAIDVSHRGPGEYITADDVRSACDEADVTVEEGDAVLLRTGHYDEFHPSKQYVSNYPGLDAEATEWLVDRGVVSFGVDQPSPDIPSDLTYPCHTVCMEHDLPHMENLRNIDAVVGVDFTLVAFPLAIRDGTGSPIRPVAIVE